MTLRHVCVSSLVRSQAGHLGAMPSGLAFPSHLPDVMACTLLAIGDAHSSPTPSSSAGTAGGLSRCWAVECPQVRQMPHLNSIVRSGRAVTG